MIREVSATIFEVESFSMLGLVYTVNVEANTCSCPAWTHGRRPCKHITAVRKAVQAGQEQTKGECHDRRSAGPGNPPGG